MNKTAPGARSGFTLVELLVVIAIIGILASILFPVFVRARAEGKRTTCLSNLRQIGDAAQIYADDSEGYLPMGHVVTSGYGAPASPTYWYRAMQPLLSSAQLVRCPSDPDVTAYLPERNGPSAGYETPEAGAAVYTSYLINGVFTDRWGSRPRTRMSGVRHPCDTILFSERNTRQLSRLGWSNDDDYHPWERATGEDGLPVFWGPNGGMAAARHSGGADYLYADGHVAWRKFSQTYSPDGLNQHLP
jgi:prepilin-type N-terminal cleavage/methylation domain-containing protein/prepilin-type processing-associated H-X9-DG protein